MTSRQATTTCRRPFWSLVALLTLVPAIVLLFYDLGGALFLFGVTLLDALVFHLVLPRRYQIFDTRLRIVLGWPLHWDIPLATIKEARPARPLDTWVYGGVRFATSTRTAVELTRKKGLGAVISPSDRERFLQRLNEALASLRTQWPGR